MVGVLPWQVRWPIEFFGAVIKAYLLVTGAKLGYWAMGGGRPGLWGAFVGGLLTILVIGVTLIVLRRALGRLAEWLVQRTLVEMRRQRPPTEAGSETNKEESA